MSVYREYTDRHGNTIRRTIPGTNYQPGIQQPQQPKIPQTDDQIDKRIDTLMNQLAELMSSEHAVLSWMNLNVWNITSNGHKVIELLEEKINSLQPVDPVAKMRKRDLEKFEKRRANALQYNLHRVRGTGTLQKCNDPDCNYCKKHNLQDLGHINQKMSLEANE